jgi:hypothetical protein
MMAARRPGATLSARPSACSDSGRQPSTDSALRRLPGPPHPHAVEKSDDRGRAAAQRTERAAVPRRDRLRAGDAARVQVLHQRQEKRYVAGRDAFFVERQDEIGVAGVDEKIGVLDALGDALVGLQLPQIVA